MILLIDNYDSFTYNLYDYIRQCGEECKLYRNDEISMDAINHLAPTAFVFSPGPKKPSDHPLMFQILKKYANKLPILGICLGHQAIGEFYGAKLEKSPVPAHGKTLEIVHSGHPMYEGIPRRLKVGRYHSLIIPAPLPDELEVTAAGENGLVMSLAHKNLPLWGMQFHPESILTQHGLRLMENWIALTRKKANF